MAETANFHVVPATATATPRDATASQDRALAFRNMLDGSAGVVVCDGVGSFAGSGATAESAASAVRRFMNDQNDMVQAVGGCCEAAAHAVRGDCEGATTLLVAAADRTGRVGYGIVGNGAVVEVLANEPVPGRWRLHYAELTFPHVGYDRGRPALESFLPATDPTACAELGELRLRPDRHRLFLLCSDGLVTEDAPLVLRDERHGGLWRQVPTRLASLLSAIEESWPTLVASATPEHDLPLVLQDALSALADAGELDDDATVAGLLLLAHRSTNAAS